MITYLITSSLENEIMVFEKSLEKVLNFRSKSLYEPSLNAFLLLGAVILKNVVTPRKEFHVVLFYRGIY